MNSEKKLSIFFVCSKKLSDSVNFRHYFPRIDQIPLRKFFLKFELNRTTFYYIQKSPYFQKMKNLHRRRNLDIPIFLEKVVVLFQIPGRDTFQKPIEISVMTTFSRTKKLSIGIWNDYISSTNLFIPLLFLLKIGVWKGQICHGWPCT